MKVFTLNDDLSVSEGAKIVKKNLKNDITLDAVLIGQEGRGRELGVIPVQLLTPWDGEGERRIKNVKLGTTQSGHPKFLEVENDNDTDIVIVARTPIGFRGGNKHLLDIIEITPESVFPNLKVISWGIIAQGIAGYMGSGYQFVWQITPPIEIKIKLEGRLYGRPADWKLRVSKDGSVKCAPTKEWELI
ncbi:MAG: hypothetical protein NC904_09015 [Candidatus Omnitrophica bacterium]|nr:hypothetical protein [Candidatus Omnitrophota bacterium]